MSICSISKSGCQTAPPVASTNAPEDSPYSPTLPQPYSEDGLNGTSAQSVFVRKQHQERYHTTAVFLANAFRPAGEYPTQAERRGWFHQRFQLQHPREDAGAAACAGAVLLQGAPREMTGMAPARPSPARRRLDCQAMEAAGIASEHC